jgi:hypothetical protein
MGEPTMTQRSTTECDVCGREDVVGCIGGSAETHAPECASSVETARYQSTRAHDPTGTVKK